MLANPALLIVDMQRYFIHPEGEAFLADAPAIVPKIACLVEAFNKAHRPVIFTRQAHAKDSDTGQMGRWWRGKVIWESDENSTIIPELQPTPPAIVVTKTHYSAFEETDLDDRLKQQHIETLVICGVMTNLCVETTARHAFVKNYQPIIVEDACATKNREYHRASILNLAYGFAHIETTDELLRKLS